MPQPKAPLQKTLSECSSYKEYLQLKLGRGPGRSGSKTDFAKALRCHPAYISLVLNGNSQLSLEQAQLANEFFAHSEPEAHIFLLLVQKERAGTPELARYFTKLLDAALGDRKVLSKRIQSDKLLADAQRVIYVSSWLYSALHVAVMSPELRTVSALCSYFGQAERNVRKALAFLVQTGLVKEERGRYSAGPTAMHYGRDTALTQQFHNHWRLRSVQNAQFDRSEDLHYSSVICLGRKDIPKAKEVMMRAIEEIRKIVKESPEEEVVHYSADFFSLRS